MSTIKDMGQASAGMHILPKPVPLAGNLPYARRHDSVWECRAPRLRAPAEQPQACSETFSLEYARAAQAATRARLPPAVPE